MTSYRLSREAFQDLIEIWNHIASDSLGAAERVEEAIYDACQSIASMPLAGVTRKDLTSRPVRFRLRFPYRSYWIVYDPAVTPVEIIRILHTSVDILTVLR